MSKRYKKSDIRDIVDILIKDLEKLPDGTETSTGSMVRNHGYNDMNTFDLIDLHNMLFDAVEEDDILLDMSEHDGKDEGLPFNLTFIVRRL